MRAEWQFLDLEEKAKELKLLQRQNEELKIHAERAKKLAEDLKVCLIYGKFSCPTSVYKVVI